MSIKGKLIFCATAAIICFGTLAYLVGALYAQLPGFAKIREQWALRDYRAGAGAHSWPTSQGNVWVILCVICGLFFMKAAFVQFRDYKFYGARGPQPNRLGGGWD